VGKDVRAVEGADASISFMEKKEDVGEVRS
jgi:hypothetical protein